MHICWRCGLSGDDRKRLYVGTIGRRFLCPPCAQHYRDAGYRVSRYPPNR